MGKYDEARQIVARVATAHGFKIEDLLGKGGGAGLTTARREAAVRIRVELDLAYREISALFDRSVTWAHAAHNPNPRRANARQQRYRQHKREGHILLTSRELVCRCDRPISGGTTCIKCGKKV